MEQIQQLLDKKSRIRYLDLSNLRIGIQGIQALAEALKINTTLAKLDLCNNRIDHQGMQALAEALKINAALTILDVIWNRINDSNTNAKIYQKLQINIINKKRFRCLQILCLKKLKQLDRINEIKSFNPIIYDSCLMKN